MRNAVQSFTKYVPTEVVKDLLVSGHGLAELSVQKLDLTVLFTDGGCAAKKNLGCEIHAVGQLNPGNQLHGWVLIF